MICGITNISLDIYKKPEYFYSGFFIMKNVDYIIVGDGYAALFFAHQLTKNKKSFVIFSEGKKNASQISAGIINPVVLKRFSSFWLAQEQIDFFKKTLSEVEAYTGKNYYIPDRIHRIFHDEAEKILWLKKIKNEDLNAFLSPEFRKIEVIKNDFETGKVDQSARLDVEAFFSDMNNYLQKNHHLISEKFEYSLLNSETQTYKNVHFQHLVFCEGMSVQNNPYFSEIPVESNKGHHLKVKLSVKVEEGSTLKKKHFLFALDENFHYYGGTYDRDQIEQDNQESALDELKKGLAEFYPHPFEIEEINFGFRPTVKDRRPIIGRHSKFENLYVFNGLGARGILNGSYFSKQLFDFIEYNSPLNAEVDSKRFL